METRPLSELNYDDAKEVVLDRFGAEALQVLDLVMRNPLRNLCHDAGDIVYDDSKPVCFQACTLRRMYLGKNEIFGKVSGLTCLKRGAPAEAYIDVRIAASRPRNGSVIGFGNSMNGESAYAARRLARTKKPILFIGPESCTRFLWRAVRPLECLAYFIRRKIFKAGLPNWKEFSTLSSADYEVKRGGLSIRRLMEIKPEFFDLLMAEYLKTNEGLVCSRTAEEIEWVFGDRIRDGRCVLLGAFKDKKPVGYIVLKTDCHAKRWEIMDWFAQGDHPEILQTLLHVACRFLSKKTPAMMMEVKGFPTWVQPLLKKYLPHGRQIGHNSFSWGSRTKEFREAVLPIIDTPKSWFFGPYDGDECIC